MPTFKIGDRVKFTLNIEGYVTDVNADGTLEINPTSGIELYSNPDGNLRVDSIDPAICTFTEPKNWPPQVGDVWHADGGDWYTLPSGSHSHPLVSSVRLRLHDSAFDLSRPERAEAFKALNPTLMYRPTLLHWNPEERTGR